MTLKFYSQFAKQYLQELLSGFGNVEVSPEIEREQEQAIVLFFPNSEFTPSNSELGLLARIAQSDCALNVYCDSIDEDEVLNCIRKLFSVLALLQSQAKQNNLSLEEDKLPSSRILVPSASIDLLDGFGGRLKEDWPCGIYFLPPIYRTAIVAIDSLPITPDTLWLRLLGKGEIQRQAICELLALPENSLPKQNTLQLISHWHTALIQHLDDLTPDEQELIANFSLIVD